MAGGESGTRAPVVSGSAQRRTTTLGTFLFWILFAVALAVRVGIALGGQFIHHPDEIFQTIEQSHRVVFGYGLVPWEYVEGIRWWGLPLFLSLPMRVASWFGGGPDVYMPAIHIMVAAISVLPFPYLFVVLSRRFGGLIAALSCAIPMFWYENIALSSNTLSDSISAPFLGLCAILPFAIRWSWRSLVVWTGLLVLTFSLRFHLAPALAVIAISAWVLMSARDKKLSLIFVGLWLLVVAVFDMATGLWPFQHVWLNLWRNIFDGVAATFGTSPWYTYLESMVFNWGAVAGGVGAGIVLVTIRQHWRLTLPAILVVLAFSFIGHKEYRFYFPATLLMTIAMAWAVAYLARSIATDIQPRGLAWIGTLFPVLVCAVIAIPNQARFQILFQQQEDNEIAAMRYLAQQDDLCGVITSELIWYTAGYVYLHRDVPFAQTGVGEASLASPEFNYLHYVDDGTPPPAPYMDSVCFNHPMSQAICVAHRAGDCG
ncbi:hypothetical protein [Devosia psychrophila]|nr:hypothetical protein [Devosia psychrophila]